MPEDHDIPTEKLLWLRQFKRIAKIALSVEPDIDELLELDGLELLMGSSTETPQRRLQAAKDAYEEAATTHDLARWPEVARRPVEMVVKQAKLAEGKGDDGVAKAIASYTAATTWVARVGTDRVRADELEGDLADGLRWIDDKLDDYEEDDDNDALTALRAEHGRLDTKTDQLRESLYDAARYGAYVQAIERTLREVGRLRARVRRYPLRAGKTLDLVQGSVIGDGGQDLLTQIDSKGVCLALALDWLTLPPDDGSGVVSGQITQKHLQWQTTYQLEGLFGRRNPEDVLVRVRAYRGDPKALAVVKDWEAATERIKALLAEIRHNEDALKQVRVGLENQEKIKKEAQAEYTRVKDDTTLDSTARELELDRLDDLITDTMGIIANIKAGIERMTKAIATARDGMEPCRREIERLRVDKDVLAGLFVEQWDVLTAVERSYSEQRSWWQDVLNRWVSLVPTALAARMGVVYDGDTTALVAGPDERLSADSFAEMVVLKVTDLDDGQSGRWEVSLELDNGGHALGLKATHGTDGGWLIDFLDPNVGAFQFTGLDAFETHLQKLIDTIYPGQLKAARMHPIKVLGTDTDSEVVGPKPQDRWYDDWLEAKRWADRATTALEGHRGALKAGIEARILRLKRLLPIDDQSKAFRADPNAALLEVRELDAKVARTQMDLLVADCKLAISTLDDWANLFVLAQERAESDDTFAGRVVDVMTDWDAGELVEACAALRVLVTGG